MSIALSSLDCVLLKLSSSIVVYGLMKECIKRIKIRECEEGLVLKTENSSR